LSSIFGEKNTNIILSTSDRIQQGKFNFLTVGLMEHFQIQAELFISTWALTESSPEALEYVASSQWFNANHFLIAWGITDRLFPSGYKIVPLLKDRNVQVIETPYQPKNFYGFA